MDGFLVLGVSVLHGFGMDNLSTIPFFEWESRCACAIRVSIASLYSFDQRMSILSSCLSHIPSQTIRGQFNHQKRSMYSRKNKVSSLSSVPPLNDIHLIRAVTQPHSTQIIRPYLQYMINRLNKMRHKLRRIFRRREMTQIRHRLVHRSGYLVRRLLSHLWGVGPIVLAGQHVYGTVLGIDRGYAGSSVPTSEVEVEVAVEDLGRG